MSGVTTAVTTVSSVTRSPFVNPANFTRPTRTIAIGAKKATKT